MAIGQDRRVLESFQTLLAGGSAAGLDDAQLLKRFLTASGEIAEASFEALVIRHGPLVLRVCRSTLHDPHDSQDAFQATFLILARKAASIRDRDALASWLYGVARKVADRARTDAARRRARERQAAIREDVVFEPDHDPDDFAALFEELDQLPGRYRDPIVLCHLDGLTYEAAARQLGCPLGTLSIRLKRGRDRLRDRLTRRGVAGPSGPRRVGASVPTALIGLTARSAMMWTSRKATASGAVSAAVASMAGRTIMAMRFKLFGVGMLALGGIALVASASMAMRPEPVRPTASVAPAPDDPTQPWVRTLPGGEKVEIIGVSPYPAGPLTWKSPTGEPLPQAPYTHSGLMMRPTNGQKPWELAVRFTNFGEELFPRSWKVLPAGTRPAREAIGSLVGGVTAAGMLLPEGQQSSPVRIGVVVGSWETMASTRLRSDVIHPQGELEVIFGIARDEGLTTSIAISHGKTENERRVVAMDGSGKEILPIHQSWMPSTGFSHLELRFPLPRASVKEFRFQTRPYSWVEFEDVRFIPSEK